MQYTHIMLDLETLATTADAALLSIGAVKFNNTEIADAAFYTNVDIDSQPERRVSHSTFLWWLEQGRDARDALSRTPALHIEQALVDFAAWVDHDDYTLWSNGADFDIPILNHALVNHGLQPVAKHWKHRCFRTFKDMHRSVMEPPFTGTKHDALADANHQAKWLQDMWAYDAGEVKKPLKGFGAPLK